MSETLDKAINAIERAKAFVSGRPAVRRSSKWPAFRRQHLAKSCAVCGYTKALNLHHIMPVHMGGAELDTANVITLGEACPTGNHHLLFGHLGNWKARNATVSEDAAHWLAKIKTRSVKP